MPGETIIPFSPFCDSACTDIGGTRAQRIAPKATQSLIPSSFNGLVLPSSEEETTSPESNRSDDLHRFYAPRLLEQRPKLLHAERSLEKKNPQRFEKPSAGTGARVLALYRPSPPASRNKKKGDRLIFLLQPSGARGGQGGAAGAGRKTPQMNCRSCATPTFGGSVSVRHLTPPAPSR